MAYRNVETVVPPKLLKELQKYIQGELIYIPKTNTKRAAWGQLNGTKKLMEERNREIFHFYMKGKSVEELMTEYHLSEDSIRKIIIKSKKAV